MVVKTVRTDYTVFFAVQAAVAHTVVIPTSRVMKSVGFEMYGATTWKKNSEPFVRLFRSTTMWQW